MPADRSAPSSGGVRATALRVLFEAERTFVDEALEAARTEGLPSRDRALLTELVYGTTRRRLTLDYVLDQLSPGKRIPLRVRVPLRLALYQVLFTRIPAYAAVDEAVGQCRLVSARSASFANAVLRRASKDRPDFPKSPPARRISVEHSHPEWLVSRWIAALGEREAERVCRAGNAALPVTARLRDTGEVVVVRGNPAEDPRPLAVQDRTQMKVAGLLAPKAGERILDLCAAPGGKTLHLADLMGMRGEIVAVDADAGRLGLLERQRCPVVRCVAADGRAFAETGFDAALADVPCSNTAVLARRPDARWRVRPEDLRRLPPVQLALLESAFRAVRPGGRVVYSTCSLEREENDDVVQKFCRTMPGVSVRSVERILPTSEAAGGFFALLVREGASL